MNAERIICNQQQTFARLFVRLCPHIRTDPAFPARAQRLLAGNRAFGSRDRRLYRELLYTAIRYLPWIEPLFDADPNAGIQAVAWLAAETPSTKDFRSGIGRASPLGPPTDPECASSGPTLPQKAAVLAKAFPSGNFPPEALLPAWFGDHCPAAFEPSELEALLARAPLWLRLQTKNPAQVLAEFAEHNMRVTASTVLPSALEMVGEHDVTATQAYQRGLVEIQDLGSQLLLETVSVSTGDRWLDACAGAGGKTLQLAHLLGPQGSVDAYDIRPKALAELAIRARRAGLANIQIHESVPDGLYDGVLVDAPCSGSGTWRRAPHLKWHTTPEMIRRASDVQGALLNRFAGHVRPGGLLVYATCSLSNRENQDVVEAFVTAHTDFLPAPPVQLFGFHPGRAGLTIMPAKLNTDGFFVCAMHREQSKGK